ncbi:MAG: alanine racemase [Pseudomonadota bacterium]
MASTAATDAATAAGAMTDGAAPEAAEGAAPRPLAPARAEGPARPILTVDLDALAANWRALDALSGEAEAGAVVKADAYGCGLAPCARALRAAGARTFFVAQAPEGVALREALGPDDADTIYVFNGFWPEDAEMFEAAALTPALISLAQVDAWAAEARRLGRALPAALHIETGINRMALTSAELDALRRAPPEGLSIELVMGHLACADAPGDAMNSRQRGAFAGRGALAKPIAPTARRSLSATGGILLGGNFHFELTRPGIGLYGGLPFAEAERVVRLDAPFLQVREIAAGETVGYGGTWRAARPSRIGVLPLGYADGYHRAAGGHPGARVFVEGRAAPVVGRVSMDMITVDLTDLPEPAPGATAEILGPNQSVDELGAVFGSFSYEVLTGLGARYARRHVGGP